MSMLRVHLSRRFHACSGVGTELHGFGIVDALDLAVLPHQGILTSSSPVDARITMCCTVIAILTDGS
jgi:hypothetical protein